MRSHSAVQRVWVVGAAAREDQLTSVLGEAGLETRRFGGTKALLAALEKGAPALLMVDDEVFDEPQELEEFFEQLRARHASDFAALVVTGQTGPEWRRRMFKAGVDDWVGKPLVAGELRNRMLAQLALYAPSSHSTDEARDETRDETSSNVTRLDTPLSVLVCDNEPMIHRVLRSAFERHGWFVSEARDGREALEMVDDHDFDLAIFDLNLPHINGFELLEAFAENEATSPARSIVLSAEKQHDSVLRVFELGADDFVSKPVNPDILVARVQRLIRPSKQGEAR